MKEAAISDQQADNPEGAEQRTSLLALSRRSRRNSEREAAQPESTDETAEFDVAASGRGDADHEGAGPQSAGKRHRFRNWRRQRPFIGGVLAALGGIELFFSGQLDTGNLQVQFGIEGLQATVIPIALVVLGLLAMFKPTHHVFYGIIALVLAVYSLVGVNLGGFILGMLLSSIGSILVVAWMGPRKPKSDAHSSDAQAPAAERRKDTQSEGEEGAA